MNERSLWASVIVRLLYDACGVAPDATTAHNIRQVYMNNARHWLTGYSKDKWIICDMAGIPPESLEKFVNELKTRNWSHKYLSKKITY